jgi:hypothetical protein
MATLTWYGRFLSDVKLALCLQDRVEMVPTDKQGSLIGALLTEGWTPVYKYDGFDAGIDYDRVDLRKGSATLSFEWDNWFEGEITGPRHVIWALAAENGLELARWRRLAWGRPSTTS